jgi:RHS repeat-associated protein
VATATDPTGDTTSYADDALGRISSESTTRASSCTSGCDPATLGFTYNASGNKIGSVSNIAADPALGTTAYSYDQLSRLVGYTPPSASTAPSQTYAWSSTSDRTSIKTGTAAAVTTGYDAASRPTGTSYGSDNEGRITKLPAANGTDTLTLSWDILGRLTEVASSAGTDSKYSYDPLDRLEKIVSGVTTTSFAYVGLSDAVCQTTTGSVVTYMANDLDGTELYEFSGTGSPVYLERNSHDDVTWTHDESGTPTSHAAYDPFGNLITGSTTLSATRWQSSYQDDSTGLYYVIARWYAPTLGRFLSHDPLTADATDPQARDPYPYAAGDPIDGSDPSGQCTASDNWQGCEYNNYNSPWKGLPCTTSCILNTSVVGHFAEPWGWWYICGPGALRVVTAFTVTAARMASDIGSVEKTDHKGNKYIDSLGHNNAMQKNSKGQQLYEGSGGKPTTTKNGRPLHKKTTEDPFYLGSGYTGGGDDYMLYIASQVVTQAAADKYGNYLDGLTTAPSHAVAFLNSHSGTKSFRDVETRKAGEATFIADIESEIGTYGVPAMVAGEMVELPSQTMTNAPGMGHWISVVGFDATNFYYRDTCIGKSGCGSPAAGGGGYGALNEAYDPPNRGVKHSPTYGSDPYLKSKKNGGKGNLDRDFGSGTSLAYRTILDYQYTWKITKDDLYRAADHSAFYYIADGSATTAGFSAISSVGI